LFARKKIFAHGSRIFAPFFSRASRDHAFRFRKRRAPFTPLHFRPAAPGCAAHPGVHAMARTVPGPPGKFAQPERHHTTAAIMRGPPWTKRNPHQRRAG
jgi:hypothetical protein